MFSQATSAPPDPLAGSQGGKLMHPPGYTSSLLQLTQLKVSLLQYPRFNHPASRSKVIVFIHKVRPCSVSYFFYFITVIILGPLRKIVALGLLQRSNAFA
jgi:hypothetical protein